MNIQAGLDRERLAESLLAMKGPQSGEGRVAVVKPWGLTTALVTNEFVQIDMIQTKRGGYCSPHEHVDKHNLFIVAEGRLRVALFHRENGWIVESDEVILTPDNYMLVVDAQMPHRFVCLEDCMGYEVYWPRQGKVVDREDIRRYGRNGMLEDVSRQIELQVRYCETQ